MSVFFNGKLLITPVTASVVNDDAMLNQNLSVGNTVAYLGISDGGQPMTVHSFSSPNEAKSKLISGELCDAVVSAFAPSNDTGAPQTVKAVRINKGFLAKLDIPLTPGNVAMDKPFGTLYGKSYSKNDLFIKVKFEQGFDTGLVNITVAGGKDATAWTVTGENVNKPGVKLNIAQEWARFDYSTADQMTITIDENVAADKKVYVLDLNQYRSLGDIADFVESLNNKAGQKVFTMTFDDDDYRHLSSTSLDFGTYHTNDFNTTLITSLKWNGYSINAWFQKYVGDYVRFELNDASRIAWVMGPVLGDFQYLTSQVVLPPGHTDWQQALDLLALDRNVQWVCPVSGSEDVHNQVDAHVVFCSNNYLERRAIVGTDINNTDAATANTNALTRAGKLNSKRTSLVHIGHYNYNDDGKLALRPAYMTAALVAAAFAGVNPGTPLTNKSLRVQGLEFDLRNPTDTDQLLQGGVMPIENTETGYKVTQSITSWRGDTKYNNREQSCGVAVDFTVRNVRQTLDPLRGSKQSPILLSRAVSMTKGALTELARPEPQGPAVLVGDENSPAWRNVTATIEGDVLRIQFEASPAIPNNYILVTMYAVPYSGSATA